MRTYAIQPKVPVEAERHYRAGVESVRRHDLSIALMELDEAIALDPEYAKAHDARGVVLAMLKRVDASEAAFVTAIRLNPGYYESHFNLGKLLLESKRPMEAKGHLKEAIELDPAHLPSIELLVDSMLATHDEQAAATLLESVHQRNRDHPAGLHLEIASAMKEDGSGEGALAQYRRVFDDNPSPSERREAELALWRLGSRP
jgi:tetratricopeptide (TPR) repeat protein